MYICLCKGITDSMLTGLKQQGLRSEDLPSRLGLDSGNCCGKCLARIISFASQESGAAARC